MRIKRRLLKKLLDVFCERFDYYAAGKGEYAKNCIKKLSQHNLIEIKYK